MPIQEVSIIRKMASVNVIMHYPETAEGREALSRRAALIHADAVDHRLKKLNCPEKQKLELLDAVIDTVRKRSGEA